jgi:hypothetical protein
MKVRALTFEKWVVLHVKDNIKIASRAAMHTGFTQRAESNAGLVFDSGGNLGFYCLLLNVATFAPALCTRIADHTSGSLTCGASASDAKKSLLVAHLATPATGTASSGRFAVSASRALASVAKFVATIGDGLFCPERSFFEFNGYVFPQIGTALRTGLASAAAATAKKIAEAEKLAKDVVEVLENSGVESGWGRCSTYSGVAKAVVHAALFGVGENRVSLTAFLKLILGIRIVRIAVRVELHRQLAVGAFNLLIAGAALDAKNLVIVSFYVARQSSTSPIINVWNYAPREP